jgi:simple sugar transport system permease protein
MDVLPSQPQNARQIAERIREALLRPELASIAGAAILFAVFSFLSPLFLTTITFVSITSVAAELGIVSIGMTILLISGHFDLSMGAILGLASYFVSAFINDLGISPVAAFLLALLCAAALGLLNGIIQVKTGIHSFIVTLGTALVYRGMLVAFTGGFPQAVTIPHGLSELLAGPILPGGFRMSFVWFLIVTALSTFMLFRTTLGNWIQAIGQNVRAAHNLGVNVSLTVISAFVISGTLAGVVGLFQVARFASVDANRGLGIELQAVAVSVIGGTLLTGGYGSTIGTMMGAIVLGMIQTGLVLASAPGFFYTTITGIIVVGAVIVNNWFNRVVSTVAPLIEQDALEDLETDGPEIPAEETEYR